MSVGFMKIKSSNFFGLFIITAVLIAAGCSSAPADGNSNGSSNTADAPRAVGNNVGFEGTNGNTHPMTETGEITKVTDSNTSTVTDYKGDNIAAPENANTGRPTQIEEKMNKINKLREMAKNQTGPKPTPMRFDAPENSYITQELTDVAKEVRVFRDHPQLARIERIHSPKGVTMKVYLKNGKVVDVDGKAVGALRDASSAKVLELAGVTQ